MTKYARLSDIEARDGVGAASIGPTAADLRDGSFSQGMRQGLTSAGGSLHALAGGVGAALGADNFAANQYAQSAAAEQLAATQAPEVSQWQQVADAPDFSTGLRRAGSYVAGLAGGAAPLIGAGLGAGALTAATGGGALAALAAGTAAVAPTEIGGALQRQQHDPVALANNGAGMRLGMAALEGTGRAAAMNVVPQLMGGKLLGRIGAGAVESMPMAIGKNLAEGIGGNAAAGALGEKISTTAEGVLNPNRDTTGDNDRMIDAAVGGAALGVPFAGMGIAGHALHGKAPAPRTDGVAVKGMQQEAAPETAPVPKPSLQDRVKGLFTKGDDSAEKIAAGGDVVPDVEALKAAAARSPEERDAMLKSIDADRETKAKTWAGELMDGAALSPENRAKLTEATKDLSSRANQTIVAGIKVASDTGSKALNAATEFYHALTAGKDKGDAAPEGIKLSSIGAGAEKAIGEVVAPHIAARYPDLMKNDLGRKAVTGTLRRAMDDMQSTGRLDADMAEHLHSWFGNDTPSVLADLHDKVMDKKDQAASDKYFGAINKMTDDMGDHGKLADKVQAALLPELQDSATPESIAGAVKLMREYATGEHLKGLSPAEAAFRSRQIEEGMRAHFGDKTDKLVGAFAADAKAREKANNEMLANTDAVAVSDKDKLDEGGFEDTPESGVARETDKFYFGGGKDKDNPSFVPSEAAHRRDWGNENSQAAKLLRQARAEHPDMNVAAVPAAVHAREMGWSKQQLMDATNGHPDDHVIIKAEGIKREGLSWREVEALKNDSHNYPESKSRIHTDAGITLDAVKVLNMYAQEHKLARNDTDAISPMHRMARQFKEAIGALSDHLGEDIVVPDETVVARRGGKAITYKELIEGSKIKADPGETARNAEREAAVKRVREGKDVDANKATIDELDTIHAERMLEQNDPKDELVDGQRKELNPTAIKAEHAEALGVLKMKAAAEAEKRGPLRDATGKQVRPLSFVERKLAREYNALASKVEYEQGRLGMGGELHTKETGFNSDGKRVSTEGGSGARKAGDGEGDFRSFMNMESASWGGKGEIGPTDQIHLAAKAHGDALGGAFKGSESMEAGREHNMLHADNFGIGDTHFDGRLTRDQISGIGTRVQQFEIGKSAAARAVGEKGRALLALVESGQMKLQDAAMLASIIKDKSGTSRAEQINALAAKYKGAIEAPKKPSAFVERVVGKGDVRDVVGTIKESNDVKGLQRVVDALGPHQHDASAREVLRAAHERIESMVEKDPTVAYNMQRTSATSMADAVLRGDIRNHIANVLGKTVDVEFGKMLHAGEFIKAGGKMIAGMANDLIRISTHSLDPMGTAYHESLHGFFSKLSGEGLLDKAHPLFQAANSEHVMTQLRTLLRNEPDALKQIDASAEERAAYMYQFWEQNKLNLQGRPKTVIEKVGNFFKKVMGIWTNDQRAEHIMEYFGSGEYAKNMGDRNAVSRALERGTSVQVEWARRADALRNVVGPIDTLAQRVLMTGDGQVRSIKNAALTEMLNMVYSPMQGAHDDVGYLPASRAKRTQVMNDLSKDLAGYEPAVVTDALAAMQRGEKGATPEERQVVLRVRKMLREQHEYMVSKGVKLGDLGPDYFPRVWDAQKVRENEPAFRAMLKPYIDAGKFNGNIDQLIASMTRAEGVELQVESIKPGMQFSRERVLSFIRGADAQPFLNGDFYRTLDSYVTQGTRRAEWAHRFGDEGENLKAIFEKARKQGATDEHIATAQRYLKGIDGTLGDSIDPTLRRAFGNAIVYQNLRILPLMIFSSLPDAGGVLVRGGTIGEAFNTFKRGFMEIPKGFKSVKNQKFDEATHLAETLGTIDSAVLMHTLGSSYSQGMTSNLGRKVNDTLFKYNLAEQYNRSMRVGATQAAIGFMGRHADGTGSPHSTRWLAELGYKPGGIKLDPQGRPLTDRAQFDKLGLSPEDAQAAYDKMTVAVNKWVDGAILRPNAAHKPLWMSDPHFALVAHLKQFVYSFQENILKRVASEAKYGNFGPAYSLAAYVPFMMAVDAAKGALLNGGAQPASRQNWDMADWVGYGVQRGGLFGVGQFGVDMAKDFHRGGFGFGALSGPTLEQLGEAASVIGGPEQFKTFAMNSMPANQLLGAAESAATNAID